MVDYYSREDGGDDLADKYNREYRTNPLSVAPVIGSPDYHYQREHRSKDNMPPPVDVTPSRTSVPESRRYPEPERYTTEPNHYYDPGRSPTKSSPPRERGGYPDYADRRGRDPYYDRERERRLDEDRERPLSREDERMRWERERFEREMAEKDRQRDLEKDREREAERARMDRERRERYDRDRRDREDRERSDEQSRRDREDRERREAFDREMAEKDRRAREANMVRDLDTSRGSPHNMAPPPAAFDPVTKPASEAYPNQGLPSSRSFKQQPRVVRDAEARDKERNPCRKCYQKMGQCPQFTLKFFILACVLGGWICGGGFALREIEKDAWDERHQGKVAKLFGLGLTPTQLVGLGEVGCLGETIIQENPWKLESAWLFCLTTITTIGWGTQAPATWGGRLFTTFYALFGIALAILCYAQAGVLLVQIVHLMERLCCFKRYHLNARGTLKKKGLEEVADLFEKSDRDGGGKLDGYELQNMLSRLGDRWVTADELDDIMEAADVDGSGFIGQDEFQIAAAVYFAKRESERALVPVLVSTFIVLSIIFGGAGFWQWKEPGWNYWESCWFLFTTLVTLGYGDFKPNLSEKWNIRSAAMFIFFGMSFISMMIVAYIKLLTPRINKLRRAFHRTTADAADWAALGRRKKAEVKMRERQDQAAARRVAERERPPHTNGGHRV